MDLYHQIIFKINKKIEFIVIFSAKTFELRIQDASVSKASESCSKERKEEGTTLNCMHAICYHAQIKYVPNGLIRIGHSHGSDINGTLMIGHTQQAQQLSEAPAIPVVIGAQRSVTTSTFGIPIMHNRNQDLHDTPLRPEWLKLVGTKGFGWALASDKQRVLETQRTDGLHELAVTTGFHPPIIQVLAAAQQCSRRHCHCYR